MSNFLDTILGPKLYLPVFYISLGIIIYFVIKIILTKAFNLKLSKVDEKRVMTIKSLLLNILKYLIVTFVVLAILTVYGIDVKTVLAGLGILGLIVGLALQDTLKDFLSGVSIILENQYMLGDTIEVKGFMGEVIYLGLKTTKIKHYTGSVKILSNRNIDEVINYSQENSLAIVDFGISYESDNDKVEEILQKLAIELTETLDNIKGKVEVLGIDKLSDNSVIYRMTVETIPMKHYGVQRQMRKRIKQTLDKENIKIPYPQLEVYYGK